ncbi:MAG: tetratricopeptide repeat protein [Myxococcales bacterium]|nr:tetratricopeptide repeat protein [Myxococcales bacterium]
MAQNPPSNDSGVLEQSLDVAMAAIRNSPAQWSIWDRAERLAVTLQRTDDVASLYREILAGELPADIALRVGERAARFHEEWAGDDAGAMISVLQKVLAIDPAAAWAFDQLTAVLTLAGRWDDLLALYDRALTATNDRDRRMSILDEAAGIAKDFAGQVTRAIRYMQQLVPLRPEDAQLAASLERLLEREGRWQDLIDLWRERLSLLGQDAPDGLKLQIATCLVDRLARPEDALVELVDLLEEHPGDRGGRMLLERLLADEGTPERVRDGALDHLRKLYEEAESPDEVIRVLKVALPFGDGDRQISLHRELAEREVALGREVLAMDHYAAILALDPNLEDDHRELRHITERTSERGAYVNALVAAADACSGAERRVALLVEAGDESRDRLGDHPRAIELYTRILGESEIADEIALRIAHDLSKLLAKAERREERLGVLERIAALEPDPVVRSAVLGEAAHLALDLGDRDRALAAWSQRLAANGDGDREALDATVALLAELERWEPLVAALQRRASSGVAAHQRLADLSRIARIYAKELGAPTQAIEVWNQIAGEFGEDETSVESLAALLSEVTRWSELAGLLDRAAGREVDRVADLSTRLGDIYRSHLNAADKAVACYTRAIEVDPAHVGARAGLHALLSNDATCGAAVAALSALFRSRDEHRELADLVEFRLAVTSDRAAKAAILHETAKIREERLGEADGALELVKRAFALAPLEVAYEADFRRLFTAAEKWQSAAQGYRAAIDALPPGNDDRLVNLRTAEALNFEDRLGETGSALASWRAVIAVAPGNRRAMLGVVRCGGRAGKWEAIAEDMIAFMRAIDDLDDETIRAIEAAAADQGAWDALAAGFESAAVFAIADLPRLAADLDARIAVWHRDHRGDVEAAKTALQRSLSAQPGHVGRLEMLADLQRGAPSEALIDTLLTLAGLRDDDIDELYEAAELALDLLKDAPRTREILVSLRERAGALWSRGVATSGEVAAPTAVEMALRNLADLHQRAGEKREAIDLLRGGANLPFETETSLGMRRKAAALAVEVGERQQAIALYSAVVDAAPDDLDTVRHLAALIEAEERYPELLVLRQHELARTDDPARRLDLRLDLAKIVGILEVRGGRVEALKANLDEDPSHDASLAAISSVLSEKGDFGHLADFLTGHAGRLEGIGDRARAARLWSQVAGLAEDRLADVRRAIDAHDHVVALEDDIASLDALARLHTGLGEAAEAIPALTRRLALTQGAERSSIVMQLAQAHVSASQIDAAIGVLADACAAEPAIAATRELLADLYRTIGAWQPLADHLLRASDYVSDAAAKLGFLREAAEIYATRLGTLDQAVPVFERICKLDPSDRETRLVWVDALLAAGRLDEARELLEQQIREFGRRRSLERAGLHFRLARVLREQGRPNEAMAQLDQAAPMAPAHLGILRMLAELAYEAGESARAERAFRALLLAIRRHPQDDEAVGVAEVQYELSRLAAARGQEIQARELYESAYATAMQGGIEARKLQRALKAHGDHGHLAGLLEVRLKEVEEPSERAEVLAELANLRELEGKSDEAFEIRLKALQDAPGSAALHTAARDQAIRAGLSLRYVEVLRTLVERHRRRDEAPLAADLWLRLAELTETELKDLDQANECFAKAEATGERQVEAWIGLARIAAIRGDHQRQAELFEKIAALPAEAMTPENRAQATYGLAELRLADPERRDDGVTALKRALTQDGRYDLAEPILRRALAAAPDHEGVVRLYEKTLRELGDAALLLSFLEARALREDALPEVAREAAELALKGDDPARAEALLNRTIELARERPEAGSHHGWALLTLATRRRDAGDLQSAVGFLRDATPIADATQVFALGLSLAQMAVREGDLNLGAELYEELLTQDRSNRAVWEPLMQVYRELDEHRRLQRLVEDTIGYLSDPQERNGMRMELARALANRLGGETDAVRLLRDVLLEDAENTEAEAMLAAIFERTGYDAELSELLQQQFLNAQERGDTAAIVSVALRLGELMRASHLDEALATYRQALEAAPDNRELIEAILSLLDEDHDPREKAELKERLAAGETGEAAVTLAFEVAKIWEDLGDNEAALRVLQRAYQAESWSDALRSELEGRYRASEDWEHLAELLSFAAEREASPERAAEILREVADLYRERLGDPSGAIKAIRQASGRNPNNLDLLRELASMLAEVGEHRQAIDELSHAIDWQPMDNETMLELLKTRAEYRTVIEDEGGAVSDLEQAYEIAGASMVGELMAALESLRASAARRDDRDAERRATLRLVDILGAEGGADQARMTLALWVERSPSDVEAIRRLLDIDTAGERWDAVIESCGRLIDAESGDAQVDAALRLIAACEKAERAEDAREGLEKVYAANPDNAELRGHLKKIYEEAEDYAKIAKILIAEAKAVEDEEQRFLMLRQAGELMLDENSEAAAEALKQALELRPTDQAVNLLLVEAYTSAGNHKAADEILDTAIEAMRGRRSPELCVLQYQKAKVAKAMGDAEGELQLLKEAYHSDRNNGDVAVELADLAEKMEDYDLAIRVLRSIALMEAAPISRAVAYLRQGYIAERRGDRQKAVLWGRKALMEDPNCQEATDFLLQIGEL